jgi:peptidoglycan/LPS O-acetylase OafA/YrhL
VVLPRGLSTYLDFVRVGAALVVLLSHAWEAFLPNHQLPWPGHQAVIVFFVISGFVIAHVSATKEKELGDFALSRAVRILSVTIPALVLSLAVAWLIGSPLREAFDQTAINFVFLGQSWFLNIMPSTNQPYWSLCYEVFYYAIFAAAVFPRDHRAKAGWTICVCLLAGPKILLLMPCWLCGVVLYRNLNYFHMSEKASLCLFFVSIVIYALFFWFNVSVHIRDTLEVYAPQFIDEISASNQFIGDFVLALIVSANFLAVSKMNGTAIHWVASQGRFISQCAGFTLSLYLYHQPVIFLLKHFGAISWLGVILTLAVPIALAPLTEHRRGAIKKAIRAALIAPAVS